MRKSILLLLVSLVPLYGGARDMAISELKNTAMYIKSVAPKVRTSGSQKAEDLLRRAIEGTKKAKLLFERNNYQLSILYSKEARELASFAVKVAIGRIRTKEGLLLCKNTIEYIYSMDNSEKHYQNELNAATKSLRRARTLFGQEEYKPALLELKRCSAILKGILARVKNLSHISQRTVKEELRIVKGLLKSSRDPELKVLYNRAIFEYQRGNYDLSILILKSIERKIKSEGQRKEELLKTKEKEILYRVKNSKIPPERQVKIQSLLEKYKESMYKKEYDRAKRYLSAIEKLLSTE